jgi:hypothetical protein
MEENRWKPMVEGYDQKLFNKLFEKTKGLRINLTSGISKHRLGVDRDDILSWFDTKFMFVFNKYYDEMDEELLLAHIIKSLQFFQLRIMRYAYTIKHTQEFVPVEDFYDLENYELDNPWDNKKQEMLDSVLEYLKTKISDNAQVILQIKLNPPPYITKRLKGKNNIIPNYLIADYLGMDSSNTSIEIIRECIREIDGGIKEAREFFKRAG